MGMLSWFGRVLGGGDKNKPAPPPPAPPQPPVEEEAKRIEERIEKLKMNIAEAKRIEERTEKLKKKAVALVTSAQNAIGTSKLQDLENIYDRLDDLSLMVEVVDKSEAIPWFDSARKAVEPALINYLEYVIELQNGKEVVDYKATALMILKDWQRANE